MILCLGGIKNFTTLDSAYEKWVLTRPFQADYVDALLNKTGMNKAQDNPRKCVRDSEISKLEDNVKKIVNVLTNGFINPFNIDLARDKLYNLASGTSLPDNVSKIFLTVQERGTLLRDIFFDRINSKRV